MCSDAVRCSLLACALSTLCYSVALSAFFLLSNAASLFGIL